jgi:LysR family hca operon transcriptional activator
MELRHLRYFVAIAEEGSFTQAAERRLHTAQPSLSRQIRQLETEIGAELIMRGPRGMRLTAAGIVFLDHARAILASVGVAAGAARRAASPAKAPFTVGFLTGHELGWLPRVLAALQDHLPRTELTVHSASSPELEQALLAGEMDMAFLRPSEAATGITFVRVAEETLFALLPVAHRLAALDTVPVEALAEEKFVSISRHYAPALRNVIDTFLNDAGIRLTPVHEAETLPMVVSMILSTGGVSMLPEYMAKLLPQSVVGRRLAGTAPTIALALGYCAGNASPLLRHILAHMGTEFSEAAP